MRHLHLRELRALRLNVLIMPHAIAVILLQRVRARRLRRVALLHAVHNRPLRPLFNLHPLLLLNLACPRRQKLLLDAQLPHLLLQSRRLAQARRPLLFNLLLQLLPLLLPLQPQLRTRGLHCERRRAGAAAAPCRRCLSLTRDGSLSWSQTPCWPGPSPAQWTPPFPHNQALKSLKHEQHPTRNQALKSSKHVHHTQPLPSARAPSAAWPAQWPPSSPRASRCPPAAQTPAAPATRVNVSA